MDIQVELVDISTTKKKLKVVVPAEAAQKRFNEIAEEYRRHVRLPGFRPGKAPLALIKRRYQKDIRTDLMQKIIPDSYEQALNTKDLHPLAAPRLEALSSYEEGKPVEYEAYFETQPQISVPEYKGLEVQAEALSVKPEELDQEIERLRDEHARLAPVEDRPIQAGDFAVVDMRGEYVVPEGEHHAHPHKPIEEENVTVEVGAERTHEAFTEALVGLNIAQEKEFEVTYPANYPQKDLAGHTIHFTLEVTDIKKKELPALDDEFAKEAGFDSLAALREKIQTELTEFREKNRENDIKKKLAAKLAEASPFEVPDVLVDDRLDDRIRDLTYTMAARGVDPTKAKLDWQKVRDELRPEAENDVRVAMLLAEIARAEDIQVSENELEDELEEMANSMKQPREKIRQHFQKEGGMEGLRVRLQRRKALDLVYREARVNAQGTTTDQDTGTTMR